MVVRPGSLADVRAIEIQEFGTERMRRLSPEEITDRVAELRRMTTFVDAPVALRG